LDKIAIIMCLEVIGGKQAARQAYGGRKRGFFANKTLIVYRGDVKRSNGRWG
jgi:hypothetical protein